MPYISRLSIDVTVDIKRVLSDNCYNKVVDSAVTGDGGMGGLLEDLRGLEGDVISILDQEEAAAQSDSSGLIQSIRRKKHNLPKTCPYVTAQLTVVALNSLPARCSI